MAVCGRPKYGRHQLVLALWCRSVRNITYYEAMEMFSGAHFRVFLESQFLGGVYE